MHKKIIISIACILNIVMAQDINEELYEKGMNGDLDAMVAISKIYTDANNEYDAKFWLRSAALQDHPEAQYLMAIKIRFDDKEGYEDLLQKSVSQNYAPAQLELAKYYFAQITDEYDQKGIRLLEAAALQNDAQAQAMLGGFYLNGLYGVTKDIDKGLRYLSLSVEPNNTYAHYYLGDYYLSLGTDDGNVKALGYFKYITDNFTVKDPSFRQASSKLAQMYTLGLGVPKDIEKAKNLLRPVISIYLPDSIYSMGLIYAQSNDISEQKKALGYLRKACWENLQVSCEKVREILEVQNEK